MKKIILAFIVILLCPIVCAAAHNGQMPTPPTPYINYGPNYYYNQGRTLYDYYPALAAPAPAPVYGYYAPYTYPTYPYYYRPLWRPRIGIGLYIGW